MSGTRFGRSGRCRFFISLGAIILMFGMVAIFQSSQQQLDETREQRMRCEQQQEALNLRLQSIVEQKYNIEKLQIRERNEQLVIQKSLEQKLKAKTDEDEKEQMNARDRYAKLEQSFNLLQNDRTQLNNSCLLEKKRQSEEIKTLEDEVKSLRTKLEKEKNTQENDIILLREKYSSVLQEKKNLELLLNASHTSAQLISKLKKTIAEYVLHCDYKPQMSFDSQMEINKAINIPETTRNSNISPRPDFDKPHNIKSFNEQVLVSSNLYRIPISITNKSEHISTISNFSTPIPTKYNNYDELSPTKIKNTTLGLGNNETKEKGFLHYPSKSKVFFAHNNRSLIINSVENFQILPKALNKFTDEIQKQQFFLSTSSKPHEHHTESIKLYNNELKNSGLETNETRSNSSLLKTIQNHRKLPDNVAPIPENFDDLINYQKVGYIGNNEKTGSNAHAAAEDIQKPDNENNRYTNAVSDLNKKEKGDLIVNEDSGGHEIKDRDFNNDLNPNSAAEENNNFFDGEAKRAAEDDSNAGDNQKLDGINDDDDILGLGIAGDDNAIKNKNNLLDTDSLKNEVMADQGKEFPDGLRLEDANEEDDDDDYSNPAARQQGAQAIRN